jgi:leucyl-tRNA synthetase
LNNYNLRDAANEIFFEIPNDLRWYKKRGGKNRSVVRRYLKTWVKLMTPFTPHLAEELWEKMGEEGFVSMERYPTYDSKEISIESEAGEELIRDVINDIREIIKVTKKVPSRVFLYTSPDWKYELYQKILETKDVGKAIREVMQDEEMRKREKEVKRLAGEIARESLIEKRVLRVDEEYLNSAKEFLQREFNAEFIIEDAEKTSYDPGNKARFAKPLKPAIYIE